MADDKWCMAFRYIVHVNCLAYHVSVLQLRATWGNLNLQYPRADKIGVCFYMEGHSYEQQFHSSKEEFLPLSTRIFAFMHPFDMTRIPASQRRTWTGDGYSLTLRRVVFHLKTHDTCPTHFSIQFCFKCRTVGSRSYPQIQYQFLSEQTVFAFNDLNYNTSIGHTTDIFNRYLYWPIDFTYALLHFCTVKVRTKDGSSLTLLAWPIWIFTNKAVVGHVVCCAKTLGIRRR